MGHAATASFFSFTQGVFLAPSLIHNYVDKNKEEKKKERHEKSTGEGKTNIYLQLHTIRMSNGVFS